MINTSYVKEQLRSLTRAIEGLSKYVQDQNALINKLTNRMEHIMKGEFNHVPRKHLKAQEKINLLAK